MYSEFVNNDEKEKIKFEIRYINNLGSIKKSKYDAMFSNFSCNGFASIGNFLSSFLDSIHLNAEVISNEVFVCKSTIIIGKMLDDEFIKHTCIRNIDFNLFVEQLIKVFITSKSENFALKTDQNNYERTLMTILKKHIKENFINDESLRLKKVINDICDSQSLNEIIKRIKDALEKNIINKYRLSENFVDFLKIISNEKVRNQSYIIHVNQINFLLENITKELNTLLKKYREDGKIFLFEALKVVNKNRDKFSKYKVNTKNICVLLNRYDEELIKTLALNKTINIDIFIYDYKSQPRESIIYNYPRNPINIGLYDMKEEHMDLVKLVRRVNSGDAIYFKNESDKKEFVRLAKLNNKQVKHSLLVNDYLSIQLLRELALLEFKEDELITYKKKSKSLIVSAIKSLFNDEIYKFEPIYKQFNKNNDYLNKFIFEKVREMIHIMINDEITLKNNLLALDLVIENFKYYGFSSPNELVWLIDEAKFTLPNETFDLEKITILENGLYEHIGSFNNLYIYKGMKNNLFGDIYFAYRPNLGFVVPDYNCKYGHTNLLLVLCREKFKNVYQNKKLILTYRFVGEVIDKVTIIK